MQPSRSLRASSSAYWLAIPGLLQACSICWPASAFAEQGQPIWWLQLVALAWLFRSIENTLDITKAFQKGLWFATAWLAGTFWWLYISMHTYGGLPAVLAGTAVLLLAFVLALYYATAIAAYRKLMGTSPTTQGIRRVVFFAAFWTMAELARGTFWTGFGWGATGYAHMDGPLQWIAPLGGSYTIAFAAALVSALLVAKRVNLWAKVIILVVMLGAGSFSSNQGWSSHAGAASVSLLQGNIAQDEKFMVGSGIPQALSWYGEQLLKSQGDIVVAPETAIPLLPSQLEPGYWSQLTSRFATGGTLALIGMPLGTYEQGYTNSVIGLEPGQGRAWRYDKHHLVPFGEFIPPGFRWFTRMMNIPLGDFNRGPLGAESINWKGQRLALNICYEDLFGEELGARFLKPDVAPTIFVNVSNIAWFGKSIAIDQHLQISRMRAIEFERPFVRATNTGATVIINHRGDVQASLPYHSQGVLHGTVQGRTGLTPYAWWVSHLGLWPLWLMCLTIALWAWLNQRKR